MMVMGLGVSVLIRLALMSVVGASPGPLPVTDADGSVMCCDCGPRGDCRSGIRWGYEFKWDRVRAITYVQCRQVAGCTSRRMDAAATLATTHRGSRSLAV